MRNDNYSHARVRYTTYVRIATHWRDTAYLVYYAFHTTCINKSVAYYIIPPCFHLIFCDMCALFKKEYKFYLVFHYMFLAILQLLLSLQACMYLLNHQTAKALLFIHAPL